MNEQLNREFVGVDFNFSQYIEDNIEEALSGVKGENAVKIFGSDLSELERLSKAVKSEIATVPGVKDPGGFSLLGQPNLLVRIDRAKAARYGFSVGDINTVVEAAIGGHEVTRVYENDWNFPLTIRLAPEYRESVDAIRSIPIALPNSDPSQPTAYIPLGDLGEVKLEASAAYIYRENSQRYYPLKYSVRGRDLGSTVADAQAEVAHNVPLPRGYHSIRRRGRHSRPLGLRSQLECLCSDRVHLAVRCFHDGWHPAGVQHPPKHRGGARRAGRCAGGRKCPNEAGLHDRSVRVSWPRACGRVEWDRNPGAAASGRRGRQRDAAFTNLQPAHDPDARAHFCESANGDHAVDPGDEIALATMAIMRAPARHLGYLSSCGFDA